MTVWDNAQTWLDGQHSALQVLRLIRTHHLTVTDVESQAMVSRKHAKTMVNLAAQFTTALLNYAIELRLTLDQVDTVNKAVNCVLDPGVDKQALRREFLSLAPKIVPDELRKLLAKRVAALNEGSGKIPPKRRFNLAESPDYYGRCFFTGWLPAAEAAEIRTLLHHDAQGLMRANATLKYHDAIGQAFVRRMRHNAADTPQLAPTFLWALQKTDKYLKDGTVRTLSGATYSLAELLNQTLADYGYVIAWGIDEQGNRIPVQGFQLARQQADQRNFSPWQKFMSAVENLTCVHPDCQRTAITCQGHHVVAWKHGGKTIQSNCAPLCGPHNAANNDDPNSLTYRGRIERDPTTGYFGLRKTREGPICVDIDPKSGAAWSRYIQEHA